MVLPGHAQNLWNVTFRLRGQIAPGARNVFVAIPIDGPDACLHQMRRASDGHWVADVCLRPGSHAYLYCIDGVWYNDPADDGRMPSPWGRECRWSPVGSPEDDGGIVE